MCVLWVVELTNRKQNIYFSAIVHCLTVTDIIIIIIMIIIMSVFLERLSM